MLKPIILIIEAERLTSQYYNNIFAKINIENVTHINNNFEIISTLKRFEPDFIVIDVALLDEEISLNILEKLFEYQPEIPLAVISSIFLPEILKKLKSFPNSEFFLKPLDIIKFTNMVNRILPFKKTNKKSYFKNTFSMPINTNLMHYFSSIIVQIFHV